MTAFLNELEWNPSSFSSTFPQLLAPPPPPHCPSKGWDYKGVGGKPQGLHARVELVLHLCHSGHCYLALGSPC